MVWFEGEWTVGRRKRPGSEKEEDIVGRKDDQQSGQRGGDGSDYRVRNPCGGMEVGLSTTNVAWVPQSRLFFLRINLYLQLQYFGWFSAVLEIIIINIHM